MKALLSLVALSALSTSCVDVGNGFQAKKEKKKSNRVTNTAATNQIIENEGVQLKVISESALREAARRKSILSITNPQVMSILSSLPQGAPADTTAKSNQELAVQQESLLVGFPLSLIGEQSVFGGVITEVSDKENESLGTLKLTDLAPLHVRTVISRLPDGNPTVTLVGCAAFCSEDSELTPLLNLPIVGFDQQSGMIILDLSSLGKELNLVSMLDPAGEYTQLKTVASDTVSVDFDLKTLVFDVQTKMIPLAADPTDAAVKTTDFTVRWYMKLGSGFNPSYKPRNATPGVGFFTTQRSGETKITRFSTADNASGQAPVKYFIKNVPQEFKAVFARAMDSWNTEFQASIGRDLLSYEFVDATDPRAELLVPGDIRFNIIEWDLVNRAGYGGLGPSVANQFTGEIMSANVLIQGPTIVKLYKEWFGVSEEARNLIAQGKNREANELMKAFEAKASREIEAPAKTRYQVKLGKHLDLTVQAQRPELQDKIKKPDFEIVPAGITYEQYMDGYMFEIVAHEMGHNLGLRHNFKGNLGAYENIQEPGAVSRSVMEYLGRPFRHLNVIGSYDRMAINYGYRGLVPRNLNWFCTDEDQGDDAVTLKTKSPECSKDDATSDPFSYLESRLNRVLDLVVDTKSSAAPAYKTEELKSRIDGIVQSISAYALAADATADSWTNFFGKNGRPEHKSQVKAYVQERLKRRLCNPALDAVIKGKESAEASQLAQANLDQLKKLVAEKTTALGIYTAQDLDCAPAPVQVSEN
jgi:hypothetical protein